MGLDGPKQLKTTEVNTSTDKLVAARKAAGGIATKPLEGAQHFNKTNFVFDILLKKKKVFQSVRPYIWHFLYQHNASHCVLSFWTSRMCS